LATVSPPKTWLAAVLGIFLQPFVFLYAGRPRLFWSYLVVALVVAAMDWYLGWGLHLLLSLICPLHACWVIRRSKVMLARPWYSRVWMVVGFYLGLMLSILLVRALCYEPYAIPSASMHPGLVEGDVVVVQKWGFAQSALYGYALPAAAELSPTRMQRGKVYVFYPPDTDALYVKRLLALPGDVIALTEQGVVLNGKHLTRRQAGESEALRTFVEQAGDQTYQVQYRKDAPAQAIRTFKIPEGHYFFLGDNRDNSDDSRHWGSVQAERIVGEVVAVVPN